MEWLTRLLRWLRSLAGGKDPAEQLEEVSVPKLERERAELENEQDKVLQKVQGLEERWEQLLVVIGNEPSQRKKEMLAAQANQVQNDLKAAQRRFNEISLRIAVIQGIVGVKEPIGAGRETGRIIDTVVRNSPEALTDWAENVRVNEEAARETIMEVKQTLDVERGFGDVGQDESIQAILAAAEDLKAARSADQEPVGQSAVDKPEQAPRRKLEQEV